MINGVPVEDSKCFSNQYAKKAISENYKFLKTSLF